MCDQWTPVRSNKRGISLDELKGSGSHALATCTHETGREHLVMVKLKSADKVFLYMTVKMVDLTVGSEPHPQ